MTKKSLAGAILMLLAAAPALASQPTVKPATAKDESMLRTTFPKITVNSFKQSPIPGLYEVVAGNQIFYFSPKGYLIFGEIWSKNGKNITAEHRSKLLKKQVDSLDLSNAIKIGNGPIKVVEFTDPHCPYCRKTENYFAHRKDVTRYVFLFPLGMIHPHSVEHSKFILCSDKPVQTYLDVTSGKYDNKAVSIPTPCDASSKLKAIEAEGHLLGVHGTPALWIDGQQVSGDDFQRMDKLLKEAAKERVAKTERKGGEEK